MDSKKLKQVIEEGQDTFKTLAKSISDDGGLTMERYHGFLTMQYHLTQGVQEHFYRVAGSKHLSHKKKLKDFLVEFANEEEHHFKIAQKDLKNLGKEPGPIGLDVQLWHAFFDKVIPLRPFLRLGATCVLENISGKSTELIKSMLGNADFLTPKNTVFVVIHMHGEELPHGEQIVKMMLESDLNEQQWEDVLQGAKYATTMYLRMFKHAMGYCD